MTHKQAYEDRQYLWSIAPGDDMTGGYVDQDDLEKLLKNPTAKVATECLCNQIGHWFTAGYDTGGGIAGDPRAYIESDPRVRKIAERHGYL